MIDTSSFTLFIVTSIAVIFMPGPAMLFVISNGLTRGSKASIAAAFGTTAGVSFHLLCVAVGLRQPVASRMVLRRDKLIQDMNQSYTN